MGLLDRLKRITFGKREPEQEPTVTTIPLQEEPATWVPQLLEATGISQEFERFTQKTAASKEALRTAAKVFTSDKTLERIPERARTVSARHGDQYAKQLGKLLDDISFTDVFAFDDERHEFHDAMETFRDRTKKNVAALQEFLGDDIKSVQRTLQALEDSVIKLMETLEEKQFSEIARIRESLDRIGEHESKQDKHRELLERLKEEFAETRKKREGFEEKIKKQRTLIRNQDALQALERLTAVEEELDEIVGKYEKTAADCARFFKKNQNTAPPDGTGQVITDLPKDPARHVSERAQEISDAFAALADHFENEHAGTGNLVQRLRQLSTAVFADTSTVKEALPQQKELRKQIMRDVAALNIYDQQQFLFRARREESEIKAKLAFVEEQIESGRRAELQREIKDAAVKVGAVLPKAHDVPDVEEELEEAEEELGEETQDLEKEQEKQNSFKQTVEDTSDALSASASMTSAEDLIRQVEQEMEEEKKPVPKKESEEPEDDVFVGEPEENERSGNPEEQQETTEQETDDTGEQLKDDVR